MWAADCRAKISLAAWRILLGDSPGRVRANHDGLIAELGGEAAQQREFAGRPAAAVRAELRIGEFQARWLSDFMKGRSDRLDNRASLGHYCENAEAEDVGHCDCSVERVGQSEAGTWILVQAEGRRDLQQVSRENRKRRLANHDEKRNMMPDDSG